MINLELQRRIEEAKRRANGSWMSILERLGVDRKVLGKRNQPCPGCGGNDRFQFTDKYGDGNYICRGCGPGDGFALLELCLGWKFTDALKAVEGMVGSSFHESKPAPCGPSPQRGSLGRSSFWPLTIRMSASRQFGGDANRLHLGRLLPSNVPASSRSYPGEAASASSRVSLTFGRGNPS